VEKERFLALIQNFTSLSEEDAGELDSLQKDFPYSQVVHNLATRAAQDNHLQSYNQLLSLSAVYSTDRAVLKQIMTQPQGAKREFAVASVVAISSVSQQIDSKLSGDDLIHEVEVDLAKLKELRHNFELSWEEYERTAHPDGVEVKKTPKPKVKEKPVLKDDGLIEEIKVTKKEIGIEGEKQKEQIQIIDQFIKTSPTIQKGKLAAAPSGDLSEKSGDFTDHIISETLVEILLRQGKRDKAIEVLRKLIWKFPQKKAIFAAQIEELKR